jgi:Mg2+ and Co2+ transporter CorA
MQKSTPIGINAHEDDYETTPLLSLRNHNTAIQKHRVRRALTVSTQKMPEKIRRGHHFSFKKGDLVEKVQFQTPEKRFIVVGLGFKCRVFNCFDHMWTFLSTTFKQQHHYESLWVDIQQSAQDEDMAKIEKRFGLHPLTTEDIETHDTGEKWEVFPDYFYVRNFYFTYN